MHRPTRFEGRVGNRGTDLVVHEFGPDAAR